MSAFQKIATRIVNAENAMIETIVEIAKIDEAAARKAFAKLIEVKAIKLDAVGGRYIVKHGAFMDAAVLKRAAGE